MRVLAIETSTPQGSVAVCQEGTLLFEERFFTQMKNREDTLWRVLEHAVKNEGRVNRIAVGTGPGLYNGIRSAIALAAGLKIAWKIVLCGIPSILGIKSSEDRYAVVGDARGEALFFGTIFGNYLENFQLLSRADFHKHLQTWLFQTDGAPIYATAPIAAFPELPILPPTAEKLASLAEEYPTSEAAPSPFYLKPPHTQSIRLSL